jgi:anti-anti-sigma regulatory factor
MLARQGGRVRIATTSNLVNGRLRIELPASLYLETDQTVGARLRRLATDPRIDELLLDGHGVREVSVRGLGLLVAVVRLAAARGAIAAVISPSPELARFVTSLGLSERLLLVSSDGAEPDVAEPAEHVTNPTRLRSVSVGG